MVIHNIVKISNKTTMNYFNRMHVSSCTSGSAFSLNAWKSIKSINSLGTAESINGWMYLCQSMPLSLKEGTL